MSEIIGLAVLAMAGCVLVGIALWFEIAVCWDMSGEIVKSGYWVECINSRIL